MSGPGNKRKAQSIDQDENEHLQTPAAKLAKKEPGGSTLLESEHPTASASLDPSKPALPEEPPIGEPSLDFWLKENDQCKASDPCNGTSTN